MYRYESIKRHGRPLQQLKKTPPWRVALVANIKDEYEHLDDEPPDAGAEFDLQETIDRIADAMEADGHYVVFCAGDYTFPEALTNLHPHICFNIAEGLMGDGREAHVPAVCELMGIPYTASGVVANSISLDKTQTKRIWAQLGLPTASYYEFRSLHDVGNTLLRFPLFIKPAREGTGMGVDRKSIVANHEELIERVDYILRTYRQPALVEEYLPGREFTVGFIGNPGNPAHRRRPQIYQAGGYHWFPILEIDTLSSVSPQIYGHEAKGFDIGQEGAPRYLCPADIPANLQARLIDLTRQASEALGVCDVARVDFRMGDDGEPYLLEINTLPGLNPLISDLCIMAAAEGMAYQTLITEILYLAAERYGMPFDPAERTQPQVSLAQALQEARNRKSANRIL